jgi:hypothetical protein
VNSARVLVPVILSSSSPSSAPASRCSKGSVGVTAPSSSREMTVWVVPARAASSMALSISLPVLVVAARRPARMS